MKILNLYAGIGGNRKLWGDKHEIIVVEIDPKIAKIYKDFFPNDKVIITDAHQYLLEHFKEFDFIWSSPPCPTHSRTNHFLIGQGIIRYPDMSLWQEIIFLRSMLPERGSGQIKWVVENVIPYYEPLIKAQECGRHLFWTNFKISNIKVETQIGTFNRRASEFAQKKEDMKYMDPNKDWLGFNLKNIKINSYEKRQILRNCVSPQIGLHIFKMAFKDKQKTL